MEEQSQTAGAGMSPSRLPVSVFMERRALQRGPWTEIQWKVTGAVAGDLRASAAPERTLVRDDRDCVRYLWTGLSVVLHKEDIESYRYNLQASTPSLFVLCRADGDQMKPVTVSMNYDDAGRCLETGDSAYAVPMSAEMYQWLEHYVAENYVPNQSRKRKKENWAERSQPESDDQ